MDPFSCPRYLLLLLEQVERYLLRRLFLEVANYTSYPDDLLCSFYGASLNTACRVQSSEDGPQECFTTFVEWVLARNRSPFTIGPEDDLASPTPDPAAGPPSIATLTEQIVEILHLNIMTAFWWQMLGSLICYNCCLLLQFFWGSCLY